MACPSHLRRKFNELWKCCFDFVEEQSSRPTPIYLLYPTTYAPFPAISCPIYVCPPSHLRARAGDMQTTLAVIALPSRLDRLCRKWFRIYERLYHLPFDYILLLLHYTNLHLKSIFKTMIWWLCNRFNFISDDFITGFYRADGVDGLQEMERM